MDVSCSSLITVRICLRTVMIMSLLDDMLWMRFAGGEWVVMEMVE